MSLFNVLIRIREEAPFYLHAWSRKEQVADLLLNSVYASRYKLYQECNRLRQRLDTAIRENSLYAKKLESTMRVYAKLSLKLEEEDKA